MNNKSFDNSRHSFKWALQPAQDIINQSMAPQISAIQATYLEQLKETNAELMRKMLPINNPGTLGIGMFEQLQATAGMNADYWASIRENLAGSVSLSSTVQGILDMEAASTVTRQAEGMLARINRQYAEELLPSVQHLVPTNTVPPALMTMAYDALSEVNRSIGVSSVAYALGVLPDQSLSPLMAQVSSTVKASAIAKNFSETITSQFEIPNSIIQKLGRTLDFYKPGNLSMAMKVAIADPEIAEAVEELIDEHPEEVQELTSKVKQGVPNKWFPNAPSEYVRAVSPGAAGIFNITQAVFTGVNGELLVYVVLGTILLVALDAAGTILKDIEDSQRDDDASGR